MTALNYFKMDIRFIKKSLKFVIILPLFTTLLIFNDMQFGLSYLFIILVIINATPFSIESNSKALKLYHSLPGKIRDMVYGRYIFFISSASIIWISAIATMILGYQAGRIEMINITSTIITGGLMTIICLVQYPLFYKFGVEKGRILSMAIYIIPAFLPFMLSSFFIEISANLSFENISLLSLSLIALAIIILIGYASFIISSKICENKQVY